MTLYVDISNFVTTRTHTGIQRVLREFLHRLHQKQHTLTYAIIYYNEDLLKFNLITAEELSLFLKNTKTHVFSDHLQTIALNEIEKNDIFFDMDGVWNNMLKRTFLYKHLYEKGVKIINFIYDLVPVVLPQYSHANTVRNYTAFLYAVYQYSEMVFFDSRSAEKDFFTIKSHIQNNRDISTRVVKLGSDIFQHTSAISETYRFLLNEKYLLFIGTLEPRKNQTLMLDVFEKLALQYPDLHLVFVGKEGWNNDALIRRIRQHPLLNKTLHWLQNVDDATLMALYQHTFLCVYISAYEGFGLPIAESLSFGNITITSKNSSMYEVGKNFADYLIYNSENELYETIDMYIKHPKLYHAKKQYIQDLYTPYTWDQTFHSLVDVFENMQKSTLLAKPADLQFVFISIHPEKLRGTIASIDSYISFVSSYIIITRPDLIDTFSNISSLHELHIIDENILLQEYSHNFQHKDHVSKNWLLRASLVHLDILEDQFIMLDDDNRPLREIPLSHFIENGKYNAYYFYDLLEWHDQKTDYDIGQRQTQKLLDTQGYELLSYSSHKPQIINKKLFQEAVTHYFEAGLKMPIDEWNIYFNYNISRYPFMFNKKVFDTLNWPENPSDWETIYKPETYCFENYYEETYTSGVFKALIDKTLANKLKAKNAQLEAYENNRLLMQKNRPYYQALNLVHGVLQFTDTNKNTCLCYGLPYFIEATQGTWIKLALNYKLIGFSKEKIELAYWIESEEGARTAIPAAGTDFSDNIVNFAISCTSLEKRKYTLLIDLYVEDKPLYGTGSPYMVELYVK